MIINLLNLDYKELMEFKIHFAEGNSYLFDPLNSFYRGEFKEWQENNLSSKFDRKYILSLIYFGNNEWLFAGFYQIINVIHVSETAKKYETKIIENCEALIGKLVLTHLKIQRKNCVNLEHGIHLLTLSEILKEKQTVPHFNGFCNIKVNFELLKTIVKNESASWKKALGNAKGVYLITNLKTGHLYVGSAHGDVTFWDRWIEYAYNGHGGNRFLKKLVLLNGKNYVSNFQFSFLEILDSYVPNEELIARELHWKEVLMSREFGYNTT